MQLSELATPCLLLDTERLARNVERMNRRATALNVRLRPHVKTAKCREVARLVHGGQPGPITVSTLREAEFFCADGPNQAVDRQPGSGARRWRSRPRHGAPF